MAIKVYCDKCDTLMKTLIGKTPILEPNRHSMFLCAECTKELDALEVSILKYKEEIISDWKKKKVK